MYFNVNFNVFFKLIKVHLLVSELYIYQDARCNGKKGSWCYYPGRLFSQHFCGYRLCSFCDQL